ncbi:MAG: tetratricopeptide repeat protein, partial [Polyangiaceae bacterium]
MRSSHALTLLAFLAVAPVAVPAFAAGANPAAPAAPVATTPAAATTPTSTEAAETSTSASADPQTHGEKMRDYHAALTARRLGSQNSFGLDEVSARVAEAEDKMRLGRFDEAASEMTELVEHPRFSAYEQNEEGRAAMYLLGDALASAGAYEPARGYLRRLLHTKGAWDGRATYSRRAVRRLVEIAIESEHYQAGMDDLKDVPTSAPEETRGEIAYLNGRAMEAAGNPDAAIAAYASVTERSRFWAQATYLHGLILVEKGQYKEGENLFCKIADPKREQKTTAVFADERFFAVRDMARLALGRIAHEQYRFDDSRYYYYLVPRDSERLAEALYEAATSRYEKKDYEGARELLDELKALNVHHRYEDEAWILDSYVDLARCKFPEADKKLVEFIRRYEPVRAAARRIMNDPRGMETLIAAARTGTDAGNAEIGGSQADPEAMRAIAALIRVDPAYGAVARERSVLEHEASGLKLASEQLNEMEKGLATKGDVLAAIDETESPTEKRDDAKAEITSLRHQIEDLDSTIAPRSQVTPLKEQLRALEDQLNASSAPNASASTATATAGKDLPDLLRNDSAQASELGVQIEGARRSLDQAETTLARDALRRVDLRLSRLLRRARLGRIESVLGRKRALEVEIEAINNGFLPQSAIDSLD